MTGIIKRSALHEGGDVKAGQALYEIDPAPYQAAFDNASASLARAEANLPPIRAKAQRYKELVAIKAVSQQEFDDVTGAHLQAEADVKYWKAAVETARINLGYTRVAAPSRDGSESPASPSAPLPRPTSLRRSRPSSSSILSTWTQRSRARTSSGCSALWPPAR